MMNNPKLRKKCIIFIPMFTLGKVFCTLHSPGRICKHFFIIHLFFFSFFSLSSCHQEGGFKEYPVFYDFVENFHLADVQQEVSLIDFGTPQALPYMQSGWSMNERASENGSTFVWSTGQKSTLEFFVSQIRDIKMTFGCRPFRFPGSLVQTISLAVNGTEICQVTLEPEHKEYEIVLPRQALRIGKNHIDFRFAYAQAPKDVILGSTDVRSLAVAWDYVRLSPKEKLLNFQVSAHIDNDTLFIPFGAQIDYYVRLPSNSILTFDNLAAHENPSGQLLISLYSEGEDEKILATLQTPKKSFVLPLYGDSSRIFRLSFRAVSDNKAFPGLGGLALSKPTIRSREAQTQSRRANVIIYVSDALRADHLGCYGYDKPISPNLDSFAKEATVFENAIAQSSWTRPSIASLFTGLAPGIHGVSNLDDALPDEALTIAEILRSDGYHTAAFTSNNNIGMKFGFNQGFVDFIDLNEAHLGHIQLHETHNSKNSHELSDLIHEHVFDWLAKDRQDPFFLYVHTWGAHEPYEPPGDFRKRFASGVKHVDVHSAERMNELAARNTRVTENLIEDMISLYDAEIAFSDYNFGALLEELKQKGLYEESLIIFVSDHGEAFYEHKFFGHRNSLYNEVLNIPFLVKLPAVNNRKGNRISDLVQHIDILPTILDYIGAEIPEYLKGTSLTSLLLYQQDEKLSRSIFSYHEVQNQRIASVIEGGWKLICKGETVINDANLELYNIDLDPHEKANVLQENRKMASHLLSLIEEHEQKNVKKLSPQKIVLGQELQKKLRSLGYLK